MRSWRKSRRNRVSQRRRGSRCDGTRNELHRLFAGSVGGVRMIRLASPGQSVMIAPPCRDKTSSPVLLLLLHGILLEHLLHCFIDLIHQLAPLVAQLLFGYAAPYQSLPAGVDEIDDQLSLVNRDSRAAPGHIAPQSIGGLEGRYTSGAVEWIHVGEAHVMVD